MPKPQLTAERLRKFVHFCSDTGKFTWLSREDASVLWNRMYAGREAGHIKTQGGGYRAIGVDGKVYMAAKLAWLYVTGEWPSARLFYKDGDNTNLRFSNLRQGAKSWSKAEQPFSVQILRGLLSYDETSGKFSWIKRPRQGPARVGSINHGHLRIMLFRQGYAAESLAWFYMTERWPTVQIVHRNGDWLDNSFANLIGPDLPLDYDLATGAFRRGAMRVDIIASATSVLVDGERDAAQLAWQMQTGELLDEVFHRNSDPWDVSFANLTAIRPPAAPGRPGVEWKSKRHCWQARLRGKDGHPYTQLFQNRSDAVEARERAETMATSSPPMTAFSRKYPGKVENIDSADSSSPEVLIRPLEPQP